MYGNAPQIPKPVKLRKSSFGNSWSIYCLFFWISLKTKGKIIKKTINHLQKARETGGIFPNAPFAIAILLVIKIGWINKSEKLNKLLLKFITLIGKKIIFYRRKLRRSSSKLQLPSIRIQATHQTNQSSLTLLESLLSRARKLMPKWLLKLLLSYSSYFLQFFSSQLATPKNLKSSCLSPINWTPNGKLFSPASKGREITGRPK